MEQVMKTEWVNSPLVPGGRATYIKNVSINKIIKGYNGYGIDVSRVFSGVHRLSVFQCQSSGYEFYYPFDVAGESQFYESLQRFDWYYMPWKWEHEVAISYIENDHSLLEVGCAHGAFLRGANGHAELKRAVGLELNETAQIDEGKLKIFNQSIQAFEKNNQESFDLVCSFQVLEHISDVTSFLAAKINCLKKGGKLLISVPNNESFIHHANSILNMPPHHVGLWNSVSLRYLENIFPVRLLEMHYEPLQEYHFDSYIYGTNYARYPKLLSKILRKLDKFTGRYKRLRRQIEAERMSITGHTVLAVYQKY